MGVTESDRRLASQHQPAIRAPWPVLVIVAAIMGGYGVQSALGDPVAIDAAMGFSARGLASGHWSGLVTALFVHAGWTHAILNALAALAFGAPVARLLGSTARSVIAFFGFYLVCGVIGSLGYAVLAPGSGAVLIGASGAISGLMGAASRLLDRPGRLGGIEAGRIAPLGSRSVLGMGAAWIAVNLLLARFGFGVEAVGAPVAWQAHLFGYAAGLLLIQPLVMLTRKSRPQALHTNL